MELIVGLFSQKYKRHIGVLKIHQHDAAGADLADAPNVVHRSSDFLL